MATNQTPEQLTSEVGGYMYINRNGTLGVYVQSRFGNYGTPPPAGSVVILRKSNFWGTVTSAKH